MTAAARLIPALPVAVAAVAPELERARGAVPRHVWDRALAGPVCEFLARPGKELRAALANAAYAIVAGKEPPPQLAIAIEALHAGSLIVDDVEDGSTERRGAPALHVLVGAPLAINTGSWLYFRGIAFAETLARDDRDRADILAFCNETLLRCHEGQALDLSVRAIDLARHEIADVVRETSARKTGALFALAAWLGARAARDRGRLSETLRRFGADLGVGLQILDDLSGLTTRKDKGEEDVRLLRATWPWSWAAESPAFDRIHSLACDVAAGLASPVELHAELRAATLDRGRRAIRAHFAAALDRLASEVPRSPAVDELTRAVRRMERVYG